MSIIAVDPRTRQEFIPDSEKKKRKDKTKFFYLPMTEAEKANMAMLLPGGEGTLPEGFLVDLVIDHLTGWENFNFNNGAAVEFSRENIDLVPWMTLLEIGSHILGASKFGTAERKN